MSRVEPTAAPAAAPRGGSGAGRVAFVRLSSAAAAFALQLLLARLMNPVEFGSLVVVLTWVGLASSLGSLSMPLVAMRFIADYVACGALGAARAVWRRSLVWVWSGSVTVALLLVAAGTVGGLRLPGVEGLAWMAVGLLVVVGPLLTLAAGQLQGLQRVVTAEVLANLLRTGVVITAAVALLVFARRPPVMVEMLWVHLTATLLLFSVCWAWGRAVRPPGWRTAPLQPEPERWRATAAGFFGVMLVGALSERVDVLVMGVVGSQAEVALYAVATRFSQAVAVLLVAVYGGLAPRVAAQLGPLQAGDVAATQADLTRFSRIAAILAGGIALGFALLGPWLLMLFGAIYRDAAPALALLGAGFVLACLFGPGLLVLTLIGRSGMAIAALALGSAVNAALVAVLAPRYGAIGAAAGAAIGTALPPLLGWWSLRRSKGLDAAVWARGPRPASNVS